MLANWITLSRFPLLLASVVILLLGLLLDTVDGVVARRTGRSSLFGSVLDIAADRTYELVLWVCFADLGMIPAAIPLIVVARSTLTDAVRSMGVGQGTAPFDQAGTPLARFLIGSTWMRTGYSVAKVTTFCGLALARASAGFPEGTTQRALEAPLTGWLHTAAWLTVTLCVVRGLPVILGALRRNWAGARTVERLSPRNT